MEILKNKKISKPGTLEKIDKFAYIINGLNNGLTLVEIAKENKMKVPTVQRHFEKIVEILMEAEPGIKKLKDKFDTYLNVEQVATEHWCSTVARVIAFRSDNIVQSPINRKILCDKKLAHNYIRIKPKSIEGKEPYYTIKGDFIKKMEAQIPITVDEFSKQIGVNPKKLNEMIRELMPQKICIFDGWILSTRKSIFRSMSKYAADEKINYRGTLEELYKNFNKQCKSLFLERSIKNYKDFIEHIKPQIEWFSDSIGRRADTNEYEIINFMKDNSVKEYTHHLSKRARLQ